MSEVPTAASVGIDMDGNPKTKRVELWTLVGVFVSLTIGAVSLALGIVKHVSHDAPLGKLQREEIQKRMEAESEQIVIVDVSLAPYGEYFKFGDRSCEVVPATVRISNGGTAKFEVTETSLSVFVASPIDVARFGDLLERESETIVSPNSSDDAQRPASIGMLDLDSMAWRHIATLDTSRKHEGRTVLRGQACSEKFQLLCPEGQSEPLLKLVVTVKTGSGAPVKYEWVGLSPAVICTPLNDFTYESDAPEVPWQNAPTPLGEPAGGTPSPPAEPKA